MRQITHIDVSPQQGQVQIRLMDDAAAHLVLLIPKPLAAHLQDGLAQVIQVLDTPAIPRRG